MTRREVRAAGLEGAFAALRRELGAPSEFPDAALAEAEAAAGLPLPGPAVDIPFVTIDPPGARDLDQALHIERAGDGFRVHYAIADVAFFVQPGGVLDAAVWERGVTLYAPDGSIPLHPPVLSAGAASLLPGEDRPAVLWTVDLDGSGAPVRTDVRRAVVRSRAQHTYADVPPELAPLLAEVGELRVAHERARGGVSLPLPEQEVEPAAGGGWTVTFRAPLPSEDHNAQISLLTGMAAADLMLAGCAGAAGSGTTVPGTAAAGMAAAGMAAAGMAAAGMAAAGMAASGTAAARDVAAGTSAARGGCVGLLRTLPPADAKALARLRHAAAALGVAWADGASYPEFVRSLHPADPAHAAVLQAATGVMRGAAYVAFDGTAPEQPQHGALATEYAHVTAPLRRLADRYATECALAAFEGRPVPGWVRDRLADLPGAMREADRRANALERGAVDIVEAARLQGRMGETFDAVAIDDAVVQLTDPAVRAACDGPLAPGHAVRVRLEVADVMTRTVRFSVD